MTDHTATVVTEIEAERRRQMSEDGHTLRGDDLRRDGALARAAGCYVGIASAFIRSGAGISLEAYQQVSPPRGWPEDRRWWRPKDPRRDLIRAAALIVAEIKRLDRAEGKRS